MVQEELRKLNKHLPKNRKTIRQLLVEDSPEVRTVAGERFLLRRSEIAALSAGLSDNLLDRIKLPLVLLRRRDLGTGAFTSVGDVYEEYLLAMLLNEYKGTLEEFERTREPVTVFYKPQISDLMRRFHSLIVVGFGLSE